MSGGGGNLIDMRRIQFTHTYESIISMENLLSAWKEFVRGKSNKKDVFEFSANLFVNIQRLHLDLKNKTYTHGPYHPFKINDPKPRDIHKATVRDRLLHHAVYRKLYPFFDGTFIADSYSCRNDKGTHRALNRFRDFARHASWGHSKTVWVLKCDVRKFFATIDHHILFNILHQYIPDADAMNLIKEIIGSFHSAKEGIGLPLGNLASQLFVNIYMNEFDQFMKHKIKSTYYIRYADDFVMLRQDRQWLEVILVKIKAFLEEKLKLTLHPNKISIKTFASGVDFLGWVHFPTHRVLRTTTKKRMLRNIKAKRDMGEQEKYESMMRSYKGMLSHGNGYKLSTFVLD
jgi:retron-type reverse transcriptase